MKGFVLGDDLIRPDHPVVFVFERGNARHIGTRRRACSLFLRADRSGR
jgi:hypothetical protein